MLGVLFERYMSFVLTDYWSQAVVNISCNLAAAYLLKDILRSELDEIDHMNNVVQMRLN